MLWKANVQYKRRNISLKGILSNHTKILHHKIVLEQNKLSRKHIFERKTFREQKKIIFPANIYC